MTFAKSYPSPYPSPQALGRGEGEGNSCNHFNAPVITLRIY